VDALRKYPEKKKKPLNTPPLPKNPIPSSLKKHEQERRSTRLRKREGSHSATSGGPVENPLAPKDACAKQHTTDRLRARNGKEFLKSRTPKCFTPGKSNGQKSLENRGGKIWDGVTRHKLGPSKLPYALKQTRKANRPSQRKNGERDEKPHAWLGKGKCFTNGREGDRRSRKGL